MNIMGKCSVEIQKVVDYEEENKMGGQGGKEHIDRQDDNRFVNLKKVYEQYFQG